MNDEEIERELELADSRARKTGYLLLAICLLVLFSLWANAVNSL